MASDDHHSLLNIAGKPKGSTLHIAMFPWLAFGHLIPFLEYSKFLAKKGHKISYISTPRNIDRLPAIPPELASSISLVKLPLPHVDGLPENAEATMDVHNDDIEYLKKAYDGLEPALTSFLRKSTTDLVIYDFAPFWLPEAAASLGIPGVFFSIFNAWFIAFFGPTELMLTPSSDPRKNPEDLMVPAPWVPFENKVCYRRFEVNWMFASGTENVSGVADHFRAGKVVSESKAILLRHCYEFEGQWLKLLEELHNKPMIPLGLMPAPEDRPGSSDESNEHWISINSWLRGQGNRSVVYVALGSEVSLSQNNVTQLALGLESSGVPFFWVLRKPAWSTNPYELPEGYEERVKGKGIVWRGWAPQMKILSHESVGGFLTHCGWSSCVEGLVAGLPMIMLPFLVDQGLNARVLADNGVGVEVARNEDDGLYTGDSVAESVRLVMVENGGIKYKEKAEEWSVIFGDRELHQSYLENALN